MQFSYFVAPSSVPLQHFVFHLVLVPYGLRLNAYLPCVIMSS